MEIVKVIGCLFLLACGYAGIYIGGKVAVDCKGDRILGVVVALLGVLTVVLAKGIYFDFD